MTSTPPVPSGEEIGEKLKDFIGRRGQGLRNMYGQPGGEQNGKLEGPIRKGEEMAKILIREMGCTGEVAKDLTVLTLYDVAILIGTFWWWCTFPRIGFAHRRMDG